MALRSEVLEAIKASALVPSFDDNNNNNNNEDNHDQPKKRRRTGGNAAVNTMSGADCFTAMQQTERRDKNLDKKEREKKKKDLEKEEKVTQNLLEAIEKRKEKCKHLAPVAAVVVGWRAEIDDIEQFPAPNFVRVNDPPDARSDAMDSATCREKYWEVRESSTKEHQDLILRMFAPKSGVLSKGKDVRWKHIQDNILKTLSQVQFDAREELLRRRLLEIEKEMRDLLCDGQDDGEDEAEDATGDEALP